MSSSLPASPAYAQLAERARAALDGRRDVSALSTADIELGRLFAYAYRNQTIGAFHATREALETLAGAASQLAIRNCRRQDHAREADYANYR